MAFDEVQFPVAISLGATGGPRRRTEIAGLGSGYEERNALWANSRRSYNAGFGPESANNLALVIAFFEARNGRLHGFRFKDWSDYRSGLPQSAVANSDQNIGTGDGSTASFQLRKAYSSGGRTFYRDIKKPVSGTVVVAVAGVAKTITTQFTVSTTTGLVTFTGGNIPTVGQAVTAGFEFDVPVRFDTDDLDIQMIEATSGHINGAIPNLPLVEIRI